MKLHIACVATLVLAACSSKNTSGDSCPPGQVWVGEACHVLCTMNRDCDAGSVCGSDGYCVTANGAAPRILSIDGNGTADGAAGHAAHHFGDTLRIDGENLEGLEASLTPTSAGLVAYNDLVVVASSPIQATLELPAALAAGEYMLRVANAVGADQSPVLILQGEQGTAGACNPVACTSQIFPGANRVTTIGLRSVNPAGSAEPSIELSGVEATSAMGDGVWLTVLNRDTHVLSTDSAHNKPYSLSSGTDRDALVAALTGVTANQLAILVSRGDIAGSINLVTANTKTLGDALVALGASPMVRALKSGDALAFAGSASLGTGNAALVIAGGGAASTVVVLVDGELLGHHTVDFGAPPVGTILPFGGDPALLPPNWLLCDGQTVADAAPGLRDFNTGVAGVQVPSLLDDRFLMGVAAGSIGSQGGANTIATDGSHTHSFSQSSSIDMAPDASSNFSGSWTDAAGGHSHGGDRRPKFMGVGYIIRVR